MLQTTTNQLTLKQIVLKHRQLIINGLTKNGCSNAITDISNNNSIRLINYYNEYKPLGLGLDIDYDRHKHKEYIRLEDDHTTYIYCDKYNNADINQLIKLYIHLFQSEKSEFPETIKKLRSKTLKPGQLAEIISEYLNKEKHNATNHKESTNS